MRKLPAVLLSLGLLFAPSAPIFAKKGGKAREKLGDVKKEQAQAKARETREKHRLEGKKQKNRKNEATEHK